MIAPALALLLVQSAVPVDGAARESSTSAGVRVFPADVSICPPNDGDCRLTLVDHSLCSWLAELLDPAMAEFHDAYNCLSSSPGIYVCVNVLTRQKTDARNGTHYTDPYLVELASLYEAELDQRLPKWSKARGLAGSGPGILYES